MSALTTIIRARAVTHPHRIAIESGTQGTLDWAAFSEAIDAANAMFGRHFSGTSPVAIQLDHGPAACVADLALLRCGIPALPIPSFFSAEQRHHALRASGACALVGSRSGQADDFSFTLLDSPSVPLHAGTAKISFTSGSTGTPKGICLSAAHMMAVAQSVIDFVGNAHAGRHLALLPPGILLENVAGFYATMIAGGTYVALPQADVGLGNPFQPDFAMMARVIAAQRITSLILVPEYLAGLVAVLAQTGARLPDLTLVAVGGARVPPALIDAAMTFGLPVRQGYGMTECASVVTLERPTEIRRGSVGVSIGSNHLRLAPDGEILIDGPACLGRIGEAVPDGPLHTGDIGRFDEAGRLWIEGRKSTLIITSHGRNISPEWVESLLLGDPAVAQAMVHGDGEARLGALIVPRTPDADIDAAVASANARLPDYARIAHWRRVAPFTPMNGQLTGNGRIRRAVIATAHLQGRPFMPFYDRLITETADVAAGLAAVPQLQAGLSGRISRDTYIAYLGQAYHHVRHTVPLMQEARSRLSQKPMLVTALDEYIAEETGHEQWILSDIAAAGGDTAAVAASAPNAATRAMVDHAYRVIRTGNPVAFFGMVHVLEGTSVALASHGAAAVQAALGLPPEAFTYLTSHGALDQDHVRFFADLMNRIDDPADQAAIVAMARDIYRLFAALFASIPMETLDAAA
ncbi:AMP-binding protein [Sphingobium sp. HWE2-09]|uniref:AMP-binding protein n=1 Tax=Sphingobium sp. HWE2-09 TaxID=3108390 RepID=UPI002DD37A6A|nr:AMP-binding protein [Sphingobium sp. HWE2-09]